MNHTSSESCDTLQADLDAGRKIVLVPRPNQDYLGDKQHHEYRAYRETFLKWLLHEAKDPDRAIGYSPYTVYETGYRAAKFDRWVWDQHNGYTYPPGTADADGYLKEVAYKDLAQSTKGKLEEMLQRYTRWLDTRFDIGDWDPNYSFQSAGGGSPQDFLTREERRQIREAVMDYDSARNYDALSPEQRDRWREYVAQQRGVVDPTPNDYEAVESWKYTSIVWASLDAGLRPVEVRTARTSWVDTENAVLRIPKEDAAKGEQDWQVSLRDNTAEALEEWLLEREHRLKYDEIDTLWLTREGNGYGSKSLSRLLSRLCGLAGIPTENRQLSWYAIRHSVGTYMTREEGLAAAQSQLRHTSEQTTMKYDQAPVEDRRDALDRMG